MNIFSFIGLMRSIYGKKTPDLRAIQSKGLLAVKIAQHYALRVDFLEPDICRHLALLFRTAESVPAEDFNNILNSAVDGSWYEHVKEIEPAPLASASIGQVHKAVLKDNTPVVIKIIKDRFKDRFRKDLRTLRRYLRIILFFYPKLRKVFDPMGILDYIEEYTMNELDLTNEISGKETLLKTAAPYRDVHDLSKLRYPEFYPDLSNERVLVSRLIEGSTFDELLSEGKLQYEQLLELFSIHGMFLFGPGVFHGDIHPGNIIFTPEGNICFVDTSAVSHVGGNIRRGLFRFFETLTVYDFSECAVRLNEMAEKQIDGNQFTAFREKFLELYDGFEGTTVSEVSLTKKMMDTIKLGVNCGMKFEKGMFSIIKSLMYLDGMVLRCRPDAVLVEDMKPVISDFKTVLAKVK